MNTKTKIYPIVNLPSGPRTMRRLGLSDTGRLSKIFRGGLEAYQQEEGWRVEPVSLNTPEGALRFVLAGVQYVDEIATPWLGDLIGLTPEQMRDPEQFPLSALPELVAGVLQHPDLVGFAANMSQIAKNATPAAFAVMGGADPAGAGIFSGLFGRLQRGKV